MGEYDDCGNEPSDYRVLREQVLTRRKSRILCDSCSSGIQVGDRYKSAVYLADGKFESFRCHVLCPANARELAAREYEFYDEVPSC